MATVKEICTALMKLAPVERKMDFDNVGHLVGFSQQNVDKLLLALDITADVVEEAVKEKAQLIVSHHPLFFSLRSVTDEDAAGKKITRMLSNNISAICMHTNLDGAEGGVNDALARAAGLTRIKHLGEDGKDAGGKGFAYGRMGVLKKPMALRDYMEALKTCLKTRGLRYHDAGRPVATVAVAGGSGGAYVARAAALGCDTLVTADVKYDVFLEAREAGINIIDGDHFCTENVVIPVLQGMLESTFADVEVIVSERHAQTAMFF